MNSAHTACSDLGQPNSYYSNLEIVAALTL